MSRTAMMALANVQVRTLVVGAVADVLQESHGQRVPDRLGTAELHGEKSREECVNPSWDCGGCAPLFIQVLAGSCHQRGRRLAW